ncbi:MAG: TldD/PmbA family protein [Dehalococcoidia bacterium]|nr:TldD/PmbA family protein [Dehalococcoidia bacterium]
MNSEHQDHDLDKLEAILIQALKACEAAEVFLAKEEEIPIHLEAGRVRGIRSRQSQTVALRVFLDGRLGYAAGNDLADGRTLIESALETAAFGARADFSLPPPAPTPAPEIFDAAVPKVTLDAMLAQVQALADDLVRHTPGLICEGRVSRESLTVSIVNSAGLAQSYARTEYGLAVEGVLTRGTDMLFVGDELSSCCVLNDCTPLRESVFRQLTWSSQTARISAGKLPAIFLPYGVASALLAPLTAGLNGKLVLEKASPLAGKEGRKLTDNKFSLIDDATLPHRPTSRPFDDEGVPSRRCPLIENGVLAGFYYDLRTAALAGKKSTGHGRRAPGQPAPAPSALVIPAGQTSLDDLLSDIKEGLIIEQVMGATQGNVLAGDFSGNVLLGYKIENGKIVGRVKDTVISGNVYTLLNDIVAVGSGGRWVGELFTPPLFFPALSVASQR